MLTSWRVGNFKSVRAQTNVDLAPLTLFAGANSSGKSSLIQSMLLMSQSFTSQVQTKPILLNGALARLGEYNDIQSFDGPNRITVGWTMKSSGTGAPQFESVTKSMEISCDVAFGVDSSADLSIAQLNPQLLSATLSARYLRGDIQSETITISDPVARAAKAKRFGVSGEQWSLYPGIEYTVALDGQEWAFLRAVPGVEILGCYLQHFVPSGLFLRIDRAKYLSAVLTDFSSPGLQQATTQPAFTALSFEPIDPEIQQLIRDALPLNFRKLLSFPESADESHLGFGSVSTYSWRSAVNSASQGGTALQSAVAALRPLIEEHVKANFRRFRITPLNLQGTFEEAKGYLTRAFGTSFKYLGPLRDEPRPLQPLALTAEQKNVGLRGEQSAAVYNIYKSLRITYIPSAGFLNGKGPRPVSATLQEAVLDWLSFMGLAERVEAEDRGKHGHELRVTTEGVPMPHDLTHVGVGVSQVFPIVLMSLIAEPDTTLIFEQPELHLHPRVQAQLGDFFLSVALAGKQCIIETHSEYIVNRLRFRAASSEGTETLAVSKMYFVEKLGGSSVFRPVTVNEYGAISDWPAGFFDQSQREAEDIVRAALKKKRSKVPSQE